MASITVRNVPDEVHRALRVLPFGPDAACYYAALAVAARNAGRGFPTPDGYIAAIAVSRASFVASREAKLTRRRYRHARVPAFAGMTS
jgi:predicted nucleic acid-binding protein